MDKQVSATIVIALLVVFLLLVALGWRRRKAGQGSLPAPQSAPADLGTPLGSFPGLYVATTIAGERFNRVAVHGLGFRAKTEVVVASAGIVLPIAGQRDVFIPAEAVSGAARATWTIDRAVEPDGLAMIAWSLGATGVESYFRVQDTSGLIAAVSSIAPIPTESDPT